MQDNRPRCHKCSEGRISDTARMEWCNRCGYRYWYGDAHATGEDQISRELDPGGDGGNRPLDPKTDS